jgi:membrane protein
MTPTAVPNAGPARRSGAVMAVVVDAYRGFRRHKGTRLGAALTFYTLLSLSPLVILVLALAGAVFDQNAARGELSRQIEGFIGGDGAKAVEALIANARDTNGGRIATVVGILVLLFGASGVFLELQDALDTVWEFDLRQSGLGIWALVRDRLLSFSIICGIAFLLLVSLLFEAAVAALGGVDGWLSESRWVVLGLNFVISFLLTGTMFTLTYRLLPHARPRWSDAAVGATITAALFLIGKVLIGLYLGRAAVGSAYGAAGSLVVLLVWVFYSTQILFFGAELTRAIGRQRLSRVG